MAGGSYKSNSVPTLVHVAKLAGVGLGTASRALSGQGYVHEETSARIHDAVAKLGYQRNELARSLKSKRSSAIGLVIPDIGGPFMASCVRAIQRVLRDSGYISIITFTDGDENIERDEIQYLIRHQVEGIIIVPSTSSSLHFRSPQLISTPLVTFDQPVTGTEYDAILVKNRKGARNAVEHLIGHGHKRIACLGMNHQLYSIQQRIEGYRHAVKAVGLAPMLAIVDPASGEIGRQIDSWLDSKHPPTAIFSLNEVSSLETVQALAVRKIRMPDQMAFIGFDDIPLGPFLDPPLTAVVQPSVAIGQSTANRLLQRMLSKQPLPTKRLLLEPELVLRGSCGCAPKPGA
jgi:LacI family transcriptional regulator